MQKTKIKWTSFVLVMNLLLWSVSFTSTTANAKSGIGSAPNTSLIGRVAPNFTLVDTEGRRVDLQSLRGKVVMIDFWASWCGPCRIAMPTLEKMHREFQNRGLVVLGINLEDAWTAKEFLQANGYTFKTLIDSESSVADRFGVEGIPTTILIGRDGRIIAHHVGAQREATVRQDLAKAGLV
jgi:peroxiredoxin